jgi:ribonuclease BN (tRNA processing enzyme)
MATVTFLGVEGYPMKGRQTISVLVSKGRNHILLDCGASIVQQLERAQLHVSDIGTVFISHVHADHSSGVPLLFFGNIMERFYNIVSDKGKLRLIGLTSVLSPLTTYCKAAYPLLWKENPRLEIQELECSDEKNTSYDLGWCTFESFLTEHAVPSVGCNLFIDGKKITFTSDSRRTTGVDRGTSDSDLLICSILGTNEDEAISQRSGFMTPRDAGELAKANGVRALALIHIADSAIREQCRNEAALAYGGSVITPSNGEVVVID